MDPSLTMCGFTCPVRNTNKSEYGPGITLTIQKLPTNSISNMLFLSLGCQRCLINSKAFRLSLYNICLFLDFFLEVNIRGDHAAVAKLAISINMID